jgi:FkbM family methyltransferase
MHLKTKFARYLFNHRAGPKRLISALFPRPVLLKLDGYRMYVRLDDWAVGARIAVNRVHEKHVTGEISRYFKPGMVLVDVGANIGYYTLLAASLLDGTGQIHAFEPGAGNYNLLQMSVAKNGFKNIRLYPNAVADKIGVVGLNMDDSNGMITQAASAACAYQVQAVTLDHTLRDASRIDLLKIDVEGAEGLVLKGAEQLIARHHPVIFTEFFPPAIEFTSGMTGQQFLDRIRSHGYELYVIDKRNGASPQPSSNQEIMDRYEAGKPDHLDLKAVAK